MYKIGSFDNEAVALFALVLTFYFYLKAVKSGSIGWSVITSIAYFYMAASWGAYVFVINVIALYTLGILFIGKFNEKLYISYSVFYVLGTLLVVQLPFIGFLAIRSAEHLLFHSVFIIIQLYLISKKRTLASLFFKFAIILICLFIAYLLFTGTTKWTARNLSLLNPINLMKKSSIVAAVAEHQSTPWSFYFLNLNYLLVLMPIGFFICCKGKANINHGKLFIAFYALISIYFSSLMSRLMIITAPAACILAALGISKLLRSFLRKSTFDLSLSITSILAFLCYSYLIHCTWTASEAYSSPSIVMLNSNQRVIIDDFREAYYWLRLNTEDEAKIMSWWDYGYQITSLSNRTVIVDNNTWNTTQIGMVGKVMASDEETAYKLCKSLEVDYVLVIFGSIAGYSNDDLNKFNWMLRIASNYFPEIDENDYQDTVSFESKCRWRV